MKLRTVLMALGVVTGLTLSASTAEAGKGVKKNPGANGEHRHHGVVTHVDHKAGHFTIASHHHGKKKRGGVVHHVRFKVSGSSKFMHAQKKNRTPANFMAVHVGERVSLVSHNDHADEVLIHNHKIHRKGKKLKN